MDIDRDTDNKDIDEDYEAMMADIGGKPAVNKDGINEDYEAMRADVPTTQEGGDANGTRTGGESPQER